MSKTNNKKSAMAGKIPKKTADAKKPDYDLFTFNTEGETLMVKQHGDDALDKIYGSESPAVNETLFRQSFLTLSDCEIAAGAMDLRGFMPAMVRDIAPRDGIERMLAVQMVATHTAMIRAGRQLSHAELLPQHEAHERAFNKLARTYTAQMEALRKHRNGGKQVVQVQHVNVADGGQAIVGNVETGGKGGNER